LTPFPYYRRRTKRNDVFGFVLVTNMKNFSPRTCIVLAAMFSLAVSASAEVIYSNTNNVSNPDRFAQSGFEFGDEITLAGTSRFATTFTFEYYQQNGGNPMSGNEEAQVRFYANNADGTNYLPGTLLWDSGRFSLAGFPESAALEFTDINTFLPSGIPSFDGLDHLTWTVQFYGIDGAESAGLALYSPPTVGGSFTDYWERSGDGGSSWVLRAPGPGVPNIDFGAILQAVPEPSTIALGIFGGLLGIGALRRSKK
jgi:hypothetical protein